MRNWTYCKHDIIIEHFRRQRFVKNVRNTLPYAVNHRTQICRSILFVRVDLLFRISRNVLILWRVTSSVMRHCQSRKPVQASPNCPDSLNRHFLCGVIRENIYIYIYGKKRWCPLATKGVINSRIHSYVKTFISTRQSRWYFWISFSFYKVNFTCKNLLERSKWCIRNSVRLQTVVTITTYTPGVFRMSCNRLKGKYFDILGCRCPCKFHHSLQFPTRGLRSLQGLSETQSIKNLVKSKVLLCWAHQVIKSDFLNLI